MNKSYLTFILLLLSTPIFSQDFLSEYPKRLRLGVAAQAIVAYPNRVGASLDGKFMVRANANKNVYNEFVVTGKLAHQPSIKGGNFFNAFDAGDYNNISTVSLLGGYRINFGVPVPYSTNPDHFGGGFFEFSAGVSYVHNIDDSYFDIREQPLDYKTARTWAPAASGVAGYTVARHVDLLVSYTIAKPKYKAARIFQSFIGAGVQYNF